MDSAARIREIASLKQGWLDGTSGSPCEESFIRWFDELLKKHYPFQVFRCHISTRHRTVAFLWSGMISDMLNFP
ncbi:MAG: hypothetical protein IJU76_06845 [Desulfovibrionaceae bacterium]|nr:hypothetical protein [Desulfovibrionaceae bacterium]